jgi:hypothetical protein
VNSKIIALVVVVIAALAIFMLPQPEVPVGGGTAEETVDQEYIIDDFYIEMLEEEMDSLEMEDFSSEMEDEIASDMSQFYYE